MLWSPAKFTACRSTRSRRRFRGALCPFHTGVSPASPRWRRRLHDRPIIHSTRVCVCGGGVVVLHIAEGRTTTPKSLQRESGDRMSVRPIGGGSSPTQERGPSQRRSEDLPPRRSEDFQRGTRTSPHGLERRKSPVGSDTRPISSLGRSLTKSLHFGVGTALAARQMGIPIWLACSFSPMMLKATLFW